jgi:sugar transferase (PEP-CTERM/EpsH1 system associated)
MTHPAMHRMRAGRVICHIIHRLDFGGLENGLVNLINHMPPEAFRHVILSLKPPTDFQRRIRNPATTVLCLDKREGKDPLAYSRAWRLLRNLRPDIVHTRNIPALDMLIPALLAGVPRLVHSEHGLDIHELDGRNRTYNLLRRLSRPLVSRYVSVSQDLARWLEHEIGIPPSRLSVICNGVDTERFHPGAGSPVSLPAEFAPRNGFLVGTVGRLEPVKDQLTLCRAFVRVVSRRPDLRDRVRLALIGSGSQQPEIERLLADAGVADLVWLPGSRSDAPEIYRRFSLFVLPSRREGISNTILEAMASGLPVVATRAGGNPELVAEHETGLLVPPESPEEMATALLHYLDHPELVASHGAAARARAVARFSLAAMVSAYLALYDDL